MVGILHFRPRDVRDMSLAEISAAIDGFTEFNGGGQDAGVPTMEEVEEMMRLHPDT